MGFFPLDYLIEHFALKFAQKKAVSRGANFPHKLRCIGDFLQKGILEERLVHDDLYLRAGETWYVCKGQCNFLTLKRRKIKFSVIAYKNNFC